MCGLFTSKLSYNRHCSYDPLHSVTEGYNTLRRCSYLDARTVLEHPRLKHHGLETFVTFDAILVCEYPPHANVVFCSLSYKMKNERDLIRVGIYDIHAKVVSFKPGTHDGSPVLRDTQFYLMGDILHLFRVSSGSTPSSQIYRALHRTPPRLTVSGKVSTAQEDIDSFTMTVHQIIRWAAADTTLNIRAVLGIRAMWPPVGEHLPVSNSIVSFSGQFVGYDSNVALLALDDLCYLPSPGQ
ncbi:hypothetical protein EDB85DRAFT_1890430 [Lactarius pseudohatsudake]|nr:hypothetical protein EDB85DRAFT_1890430 [Lactarius pseudohatsudake]